MRGGLWLHEYVAAAIPAASLVEIETIIRTCAVELSERSMPGTSKLFDFARQLERYRASFRAAEQRHT